MGIIEPSISLYCSPVVFVKKSDNSWRLCIDFRALNDITVFDSKPMPKIRDNNIPKYKISHNVKRKTTKKFQRLS